MIRINKHQEILGEPNIKVFSESGDYTETDLIQCYNIENPDVPISALQAQYIKYGPIVYQYNEPEELGEAISKIDPDSTHDAVLLYKEEESRKLRRDKGNLQSAESSQINDEQMNKTSKQEVIETVQKSEPKNEKRSEPLLVTEENDTLNNQNISTTTPIIDTSNEMSTTTPNTNLDTQETLKSASITNTEEIIEATNSAIETLTETKEAISETKEVISDTIETLSENITQ